jgi:hypothetical protein
LRIRIFKGSDFSSIRQDQKSELLFSRRHVPSICSHIFEVSILLQGAKCRYRQFALDAQSIAKTAHFTCKSLQQGQFASFGCTSGDEHFLQQLSLDAVKYFRRSAYNTAGQFGHGFLRAHTPRLMQVSSAFLSCSGKASAALRIDAWNAKMDYTDLHMKITILELDAATSAKCRYRHFAPRKR